MKTLKSETEEAPGSKKRTAHNMVSQVQAPFEKTPEYSEIDRGSPPLFRDADKIKPLNLDVLEKLAVLRDKGILTDEEFSIKKEQLLEG